MCRSLEFAPRTKNVGGLGGAVKSEWATPGRHRAWGRRCTTWPGRAISGLSAAASRTRPGGSERRRRILDHVGISSSALPGAGGGPAGPQVVRHGYQPGSQVTNLLCDCHRVVAEALVIAPDQSRVHGPFHAV